MHYYEVAPNQIARVGDDVFTYHSEQTLVSGHLVTIPLGKKQVTGVVIKATSKPSFTTKPIGALVEKSPIPKPLLKTAQWMSAYYSTPLALTFQTLLPRGLTASRRKVAQKPTSRAIRQRTSFVLNKAQLSAVESLINSPIGSTSLLHGVTGSGKTAVYIEYAKHKINLGQSVLMLVPEIALTSQLVDEFTQHFDNVVITHSRQTEAERHTTWKSVLHSETPQIVIGPRSALFMPIRSLGAVIVDEAHEPSYKQEQSPRYSALRVATMIARYHNATAIFGSATPSIADYYLIQSLDHERYIELPNRAQQDVASPNIQLIDMTQRSNFKSHRFLSDELLQRINLSLKDGKQCLIFHNRRGSASTTLCKECGWIAGCPRCFVSLTLHSDTFTLHCHICGLQNKVLTSCPQCNAADVVHKGIGTKLIEAELRKLYPNKIIVRFDADSESSETIEKLYKQLYDGEIDIIIGTQVVAKGLDLPHLRTVGVIQADAGLSLPDYSSSERTFQLLAQVIGRVGRTKHPTAVVAQRYQPNHPSVIHGLGQDYDSFYEFAMRERKRGRFPPYCYLLKLTCTYKTEAAAIKNAKKVAAVLRSKTKETDILGPTPAFYERQRDTYRWQLVAKSKRRQNLLDCIKHVPQAHWQFELDPNSLL